LYVLNLSQTVKELSKIKKRDSAQRYLLIRI